MSEADDRAKLQQAVAALGISFFESLQLVRYNPKNATASYHWNSSGAEWIEVGASVLSMTVDDIEMVLRHEFLHRCTYHGFNEKFDDPQLLNIAEDVCINRLLFEAYPDKMQHLSRAIYDADCKKSIIALADCSADPAQLVPGLQALWTWVWSKSPDGRFNLLNPTSLYYRLLEFWPKKKENEMESLEEILKRLPALAGAPSGQGGLPYQLPHAVQEALGKVLKGLSDKLGNDQATSDLESFSVTPLNVNVRAVDRFLKSLALKREIDSLKQSLHTAPTLVKRPYPVFPTYRGLVYQASGLSRHFGYHGKENALLRKSPNLDFYFDVSGSMEQFISILVYFAKQFREYPLKFYAFSEVVREVKEQDFLAGKFIGGGGTNFNDLVRHVLRSPAKTCLVFTDGEGSVDEAVLNEFTASAKTLYLILLADGNLPDPGDLGRVAAKTMTFDLASTPSV